MTNNKEIRQNNTDMLSPNNQSNTVNSQTNAKHTQDENIKNDIKELIVYSKTENLFNFIKIIQAT